MKHLFIALILFFSASSLLVAQDISVETLQFGTNVENREVIGVDSTFSGNIGQVYCLTRIIGMEAESSVTHVWYFNDEEMARVELPIRGSDWRTWSSKSILPSWTGEWSVEIVGTGGDVLASGMFTITE